MMWCHQHMIQIMLLKKLQIETDIQTLRLQFNKYNFLQENVKISFKSIGQFDNAKNITSTSIYVQLKKQLLNINK